MEHHITDTTFKEETEKGTVLVDFWAEWCGPCRMQGPILSKMAEKLPESELKICKMNVDENPATAQEYGVMSIPTMLLFKDGKAVKSFVGVHSEEQIMSPIKGMKLMGLL